MWHKLLSPCFIPFLLLTASRASLSLQPAVAGCLAGAGGRDASWQHSNNPCKLTGWGVNANAKSTIEKWLKSISVSFILWCCSCWGIKAFRRSRLRYWGLVPGLISTCLSFPSREDLTLIVFQAAFYLPHCHNHSPSNCVTSQNKGYKHFGSVLCFTLLSAARNAHTFLALATNYFRLWFTHVCVQKSEFAYTSLFGAVSPRRGKKKKSSIGSYVACIAKSWQCKFCFDVRMPESHPQADKLSWDHRTGSGMDQLTSTPDSTGMHIRWKSQLNWHFEFPVA